IHIMDPNDARLDTLASDFTNAATLSATGTHWEDRPDSRNWSTNTRTTALVLMAMLQHTPSNDLLPGAVRWLMVAREADHWETTQETAWAIMALTDWMVATEELTADYTFSVRLNGDLLELEDDTADRDNIKESEMLSVEIAELLVDEANRLRLIKGEGPGNLYYTAHVTAYLDVPSIEPVSRGLIVSRRYHLASDPLRTPINTAQVGDEVVVTLTIIAPRNLHYVVVEDPIPAGSEAIDPNLITTSLTTGQRPTLTRSDPLSRGWGYWWFSRTEFRDEKVVMYATYLPRGTYTYTYTLRMGLEGRYNVIPTTGQEFYFPEVYGRGAGTLFTIEAAEERDTREQPPEDEATEE
ncbi:MAG: alpha-2-macroglobulin, partial [Chloroflexi bacterium]|nr:alpha-2-macroglobulin [Chloroflexota bacterium]